MRPRKGFSDYSVPMKKLSEALGDLIANNRRLTHEQLVAKGVDDILDTGLFAEYEREFKCYIVTNALNKAINDERVAGDRDPITGVSPRFDDRYTPPRSQPDPEKVRARFETRLARSQEAVAIIEKRVLAYLAADMTHAEAHRLGGVFQTMFKKGSKARVWETHADQLGKLGCEKI